MTEYTAKDVRVLEEIDHIKLNAGMYIGNTENPVHLIEEALDNALDEVLAGYATIVAVNLDLDNHIYTVLDNGRGLPISNNIPVIVSASGDIIWVAGLCASESQKLTLTSSKILRLELLTG